MRKVVILHLMREASERVPGKLLTNLCGKPLAQWAIETASLAAEQAGVDYRVGIWPQDAILTELANSLKIPIIPRTERSAFGETGEDVYDRYLTYHLRHWDWAIIGNACKPVLPSDFYTGLAGHVLSVAKNFPKNNRSLITVFKQRGNVWGDGGKLLAGSPSGVNTKTSPPYYVPAHCACVYHVPSFREPWAYDYDLYEVPDTLPYRLDVDTPTDLELARLYMSRQMPKDQLLERLVPKSDRPILRSECLQELMPSPE